MADVRNECRQEHDSVLPAPSPVSYTHLGVSHDQTNDCAVYQRLTDIIPHECSQPWRTTLTQEVQKSDQNCLNNIYMHTYSIRLLYSRFSFRFNNVLY